MSQMADPLYTQRRTSIKRLLKLAPIIVHKFGASTDLTTGRFVEILNKPPNGWYGPEENEGSDLEDVEQDDNEWLGVVEWVGIPFTAPGDSGSLVFARQDGIHIPLGIHVGSPGNTHTSIFIS